MAPSLDHFTPLSRAIASIGRDDYAMRFAVYDREYKAMLRRLATTQPPLSAADLSREENAFHDAVRRVEFGAEDAPTLVPQDEPVGATEEPSAARLRELIADPRAVAEDERTWPRRRARRSEAFAVESGRDDPKAKPIEPLKQRSRRRPLMRRVWERMVLAVLMLGFVGMTLWLGPRPETGRQSTAAAGAPAEAQPADTNAGALNGGGTGLPTLQQPSWMAPQMLLSLPMTPTARAAPPTSALVLPLGVAPPRSQAAAPRYDVPLPLPRP
jgi:hypothetical protein